MPLIVGGFPAPGATGLDYARTAPPYVGNASSYQPATGIQPAEETSPTLTLDNGSMDYPTNPNGSQNPFFPSPVDPMPPIAPMLISTGPTPPPAALCTYPIVPGTAVGSVVYGESSGSLADPSAWPWWIWALGVLGIGTAVTYAKNDKKKKR